MAVEGASLSALQHRGGATVPQYKNTIYGVWLSVGVVWYAWDMTDTHELIAEIETFLEITATREMFTSTEIQNLLLDLRGLLGERVDN